MGRRTVVLVVAVILGALAAWGIFAFLTNVEDDAREGLSEVAVFRATEFIERGAERDLVIGNFVESTEIEELLPDNSITTAAQLTDVLTGRVALGPISNGQIVTTDLWADAEEEVGSLSELIAPGKQAIVVRPDEVKAVGGFVRPGDNVNIIVSAELSRQATIDLLKNPIGRDLLGVTDLFDDFTDLLPPETEGEIIEQTLTSWPRRSPRRCVSPFTPCRTWRCSPSVRPHAAARRQRTLPARMRPSSPESRRSAPSSSRWKSFPATPRRSCSSSTSLTHG